MNILRTLLVLFLLPAAALAQDATTRQAYLEGWFQETAEANLAQALKHYQEAVERNTDAELVARSLWRMGVIARAQDEEEVAQALFQRVMEEYPDSRAAVLAEEAASQDQGASDAGPESEAVTQAMELLRGVLMDSEPTRVTTEGVMIILDSLSVSQVLSEARRLHADAGRLVGSMWGELAHEYTDELFEFAQHGSKGEAERAVDALFFVFHDLDLDPRLALLLEREDLAKSLIHQLTENDGKPLSDDRVDYVQRLLTRWPQLRVGTEGGWEPILKNRGAPAVAELLATGSAKALTVLQSLLHPVLDRPETYEALAEWSRNFGVLDDDTPMRHWVLEWLPRCSATTRVGVARSTGEPYGQADPPVLQWMLADPEPQVRHHGILHLLHANAEAEPILDFISYQPGQSRRTLALTAATLTDGPCDHEEVLGRVGSRDREYLYWTLCLDGSSSEPRLMDVIRTGLRREDPELLTALFSPRYWRDWTNGQVPAAHRLVEAWKRGEVLAEDRVILVELLERAAGHPLQSVIRQAMATAQQIEIPAPELAAFRARVLGSEDTSIRRDAMNLLQWEDFTHDQKVALLLDPSVQLAQQALNRGTDSAVLLEALPRMDLLRKESLFGHKTYIERLSPEVRRALMQQVPTEHRIWQDCFLLLYEHDADVLLEGLVHTHTSVKGFAFKVLKDIGVELPPGNRDLDEYRQNLVRTLDPQREDLQQRLVDRRIGILEAQCRRDSQEGKNAAQELVALGARDVLRRAARGLSYSCLVEGLADLGDREGLREILHTTHDPGRWILPAALRVGLFEDVLAMAKQERVQGAALGQSLRQLGMAEESRRILRDHPDLAALVVDNEQLVLDSLTEDDDPALLAQLIELWGSDKPLLLLIQQRAWDVLFEEAPGWTRGPGRSPSAQSILCREMHRLLGTPGTPVPEWPQYLEDQQKLIATWRAALKEKGLDD